MSRLPPSDYEEHPSGAAPTGKKPFQFTLARLLLLILVLAAALAILWLIPSRPREYVRYTDTVVKVELEMLANGLDKLEAEFGGLPHPNATTSPELTNFLRRAFPRIGPAGLASLPKGLSPPEALVFWLGGYWDGKRMMGFAADPRNPFVPPGQPNSFSRLPPIYDFEATRLFDSDGDGFPEYYSPWCTSPKNAPPYVGFFPDAKGNYSGSYRHPGVAGVAVPYRSDDGGFVNPKSFQLIWAGLDHDFGSTTNRYFPSGKGVTKGDLDNVAQFASGPLGDVIRE